MSCEKLSLVSLTERISKREDFSAKIPTGSQKDEEWSEAKRNASRMKQCLPIALTGRQRPKQKIGSSFR